MFAQAGFQAAYRPVDRFWSWHWGGGMPSYILLYERVASPP